ncbi:swr1 complex component [Pleurotus pulmonarius]|nr:swr1 complex component [Pleurotus pulmonarius]
MVHFRNMLAYDPVEAKRDNSLVFQQFKADYDLLDQAAGPSVRRTRRATHERHQILHTPLAPKLKKNGIQVDRKLVEGPVSRQSQASSPRTILPEPTSVSVGPRKSTRKSVSIVPDPPILHLQPHSDVESIANLTATPLRRGRSRKRRKTEPVLAYLPSAQKPNGVSLRADSTRLTPDPPALQPPNGPPERTSFQTVSTEPSLPKFNIKRIKLLVRRPPPTISHPRQRPAPARFNTSVSALLTSYRTLNDRELNAEAFETSAGKDAEIHERVELFRKQGRFIPGTDVLFGTKPQEGSFTTPQRTTNDVWDEVVVEASAAGRSRLKKSTGKTISAQIAAKIQGYWDAQASKKDRAKVVEERRLRALAKATVKLVANEWKRVLLHIREQERLKLEAEEIKRGAEHLDAILDQSGHILTAQQGDLVRGDILRSRSRSTSSSLHHWASEDGDSEREDEDEEEDDTDDVQSEIDDVRTALTELDGDNLEEGGTDMPSSEGRIDGDEGEEQDEDDGSEASDGSEDIGVLIADFPPHHSPSLEEPLRSPLPRTSEDLLNDEDASAVGAALSPMHASVDGTVVDEAEHALRKLPDSSPAVIASIIELPDETPTLLAGDDANITDIRPVITEPPQVRDSVVSADEPLLDAKQSIGLEDVSSAAAPGAVITKVAEDATEPHDSPDTGAVAVPTEDDSEPETSNESGIPEYLKPYAVAPVQRDHQEKIKPPLLLRGILRPYQQAGLEWLASLHTNNLNGILADEMGLGKTIQTIALLAHLACDHGIWGPHVIIVPTSVLLNWVMEFKKFLPGFKVMSYHGGTKRRKELRQGWNDKHHFNVCITSYTLASRDAHIFKRKPWYYMILDEAHMIKNFKSQRWNILLMFRSFRRLLLTGTPLQNNLTELWALLQFLMSGSNFANLKEFAEWFSNPLEKAIEMGNALDEDTMQRVTKLHTVLRPYLLRRLKRDVEKELPSKYEHLVMCPLSKRQRFLYDEFMARAHTRDALDSGVYQKIANILMQLRKVCNHPDLFEVRPIVTSFAMDRSAVADFEIKELLIRRRILHDAEESVNLDVLGLRFIDQQGSSFFAAQETRRLEATARLPFISEMPGEPPPKDTRTIAGFRKYEAYRERAETIARWAHIGYLNGLRCNTSPIFSYESLRLLRQFARSPVPSQYADNRTTYLEQVSVVNDMVTSYSDRESEMGAIIDRFAFVTPPVVAMDMPRLALGGYEDVLRQQPPSFDELLHRSSVKLQIAFPDPSLIQYDCGKLQQLTRLLREKKMGGHRVLIFTQMTKVLDILEIFMNLHGYLYLRLDGATKIEDRQYITERFNADARIFCFISSSRSGGVGINLTGADTVVFYDSDFNPQMDRQAHRIGQIRDVHIYRFVSQHTVEEAMLRKANQKRSLDDLVIQKGEFDWRSLFNDESALTRALGEVEDTEDARAADLAAREEVDMEGADADDFGEDRDTNETVPPQSGASKTLGEAHDAGDVPEPPPEEEGEEEGGTVLDYMFDFVTADYDFFRDW